MADEKTKDDITREEAEENTKDEDIFAEDDIEIPEGAAEEEAVDDNAPNDKKDSESPRDAESEGSDGGGDSPVDEDVGKAGKNGSPRKKKFSKGKKDKKDEEIAELKERLVRQMAEFDNFRKRTQREKSQMYDDGAKSIIEKVLPVVDNFERGLATIDEKDKDTPLAEGMEKIYKQFESLLAEAGVEQIEALGKEFDPELHNAVMHVEDENFGENVVSQELQKGYTYHGTVVRHTMVVVAN